MAKNSKKNETAPQAQVVRVKTPEHEATAEFEERRSLFLGHARPVASEEEALAFVAEKKKEYNDATHNVWAYRLKGGIYARYSDDGEPQGTAGLPVLEVIRKSDVDDVCVVVTRYFGGILLGAGGLVRAYSHAARLALDASHIMVREPCTAFRVRCTYADYPRLKAELPALLARLGAVEFDDSVNVRLVVKDDDAQAFCARFSELFNGRLIPEEDGHFMELCEIDGGAVLADADEE